MNKISTRKFSLKVFFVFLAFLVPFHSHGEGSLGDVYAALAKEVILIDYDTGMVLYAKNPDLLTNPSSMTKVILVFVAFDRLKTGRLKLTDPLPVSVKAWKTGGSRMFLNPNSFVTVDELLHGIITLSGNDASIALAEGMAGTEENAAKEMTEKAHSVGAINTVFKNAHGLAEEGHLTTVRDLAIITRSMIKEFPEYYSYFQEKKYTYNKITQPNRNPLLGMHHLGADGLKTGMTDEGGYGLIGSAFKDGRRLILVVNGLPSEKARATVSEQLLSWGFREFETLLLTKAHVPLVQAPTWLGTPSTVGLEPEEDVKILLSKEKKKDISIEVVYQSPLVAPLKKGQKAGKLVVHIAGNPDLEFPLVVSEDVEQVGVFKRAIAALRYIFWGRS